MHTVIDIYIYIHTYIYIYIHIHIYIHIYIYTHIYMSVCVQGGSKEVLQYVYIMYLMFIKCDMSTC